MADVKHIIYEGSEVIAERAKADENGKHIPSYYATKEELSRKQSLLPNASKPGLLLSSTDQLNTFEWISLPDYATKDYVNLYGGKIDKIYVDNILQPITNKEVRITLPKYTANLSELINDIGFITLKDLPAEKTNLSEFTNDSGFITSNDLPAEKTKLSEFINDTNYTTIQEVGAIPTNINLSLDPETYLLSVSLEDKSGNKVGQTKTVDLPLETVVVGGTYLPDTKEVELSLQNGSTIKFGVEDLVYGLVSSSLTINGKALTSNIELKSTDINTESGFNLEEILATKLTEADIVAGNNISIDKQHDKLFINANIDIPKETDPTVPAHVKAITQEDIDKWNSNEGGTTITDTLTLSKEVIIPEVPARDGVEITKFENLSTEYKFELDEETGYYESNNKGKSSSFALCKVTFTVPHTMNVIWDVINSGEPNFDFGIFSKLDKTLSSSNTEDTDTAIVYKSFKSENSTSVKKLTYENISAGTYFITIKYRKDGSGDRDNDSLKFKLSDESKKNDYVPEKTRTSQNSIYVDDYNNLKIEGYNIVTTKDIMSIKEVVGTKDNPIIFTHLDSGFYYVSGYFKYTENLPSACVVSNSETKEYRPVIIQISKVGNYFYITLYNCEPKAFIGRGNSVYYVNTSSGSGLDIQPTVSYCLLKSTNSITVNASSIQFRRFDDMLYVTRYSPHDSSGLMTLTVDNTSQYIPSGDYNPTTVKFVRESIDAAKPILKLENPETTKTENNVDKFATPSDISNNALYYYKNTGDKITSEPAIPYPTRYNNDIWFPKSVVDLTGLSNSSYSLNVGVQDKNNNQLDYQNLYFYVQNGKIYEIRDGNYYRAYSNSVWAEGISEGEYISLRKFFVKLRNIDDSKIDNFYVSKLTNWIPDVEVLGVNKEKIIDSVRLALYEDLESAGLKELEDNSRIYNLEPGLYKCTAGTHILYDGSEGLNSITIEDDCLVQITESSGNKGFTIQGHKGDYIIGSTDIHTGSFKRVDISKTPTLEASTNKGYLVGSANTNNLSTNYADTKCYIANGKVYSNNKEVITLTDEQTLENKTFVSPNMTTIKNGDTELILPTVSGTIALKSDIEAAGGTVSIDTQFIDKLFEEVV